ncbi:MAG: 2-C-methyl-D-erythritol 4-phosphate cytidylyltransferase [Elusimicrobiales bacterium]|nr:2-C-methyl-D-erythritol 4-phosphate cytidylyltransferase [Elusimicrobiales bacterium]
MTVNRAQTHDWAAVIAAGGSGVRMGGPKQFLPLAGRPLLFHSVSLFLAMPEFSDVIVVTARENFAALEKEFGGKVKLAPAGATRLESVRNGFALARRNPVIAVHDGARPLVTAQLAREVCAAALKTGAAVAAVAVKDTIKSSADGLTVSATPERAKLWAAQTPQCYRREALEELLSRFPNAGDVSDESQLAEHAGMPVALVPSFYGNIKITTPEDLVLAEALMDTERKSAGVPAQRVGFGYDLHRMVEGRPLILGGVHIPHNKGLLGHSDGDVALHAVCDAALGAVAAGEIGVYFPPTNLTIMGISSKVIAEKTLEVLAGRGAELAQMDVTVIAEEPKLMPHYQAVRESLSEIFRLPLDCVSFKAKSAEGLGPIGKGEAMECHAVVTARIK